LVALRVFRLTRSTAVPFSVLSRKNMAARRKFVVLELVPLRPVRGEKHFKLPPQNRILAPFRGIVVNQNVGFGSSCLLTELVM